MSSIIDQETDRAAQLTDFVLADLQLRQQPFDSAPTDANWFLDGIAESQLEDIKQALIAGDDLLLILGPAGSGKSTLLAQLGANSGQRIQCFSVRGSERFSTTNLFAGMIEAFKKSPPDDLKLMLDDLIPCLQGMADHNTLGAVVLDDADQIPTAELTKLLSGMLYINSSDETLLRVVLAGPTEFEERIPELLPEGADLPYSSLAIDAFDKDRSADYLFHRLHVAGADGELPFSESDIAQINKEAGGRPGELHVAAAQFLNSRDENYVAPLPPELAGGASSAGSRFGGMKMLAGLVALAMIFAGLFWLRPKTNTVPDNRYEVVEKKKLETENNNTDQELTLLAEQRAAEEAAAAKITAAQQANAENSTNDASANTATNASTAASSDSDNDQASINIADATAEAEAAKAEAQRQAKLEAEAAEKAAEQQRAEALAAEEAAKKKAEEEQLAAQKAREAAAAKAAEEKAAKEKAEQELAAKQAEAAQAATAQLANLESPNWILVQNPALFTVQMSASKDRKSVENFLARNKLDAPNSIFSFNRNGATWYALVHGLYGSIEEARKDIEQMPDSARSNQPWIRAVGRIQNAVKNQ